MATSTSWPRPEPWRSLTAARVPITAKSAASASPSEIPARAGGRSGSPVVWRTPPIASPIAPKPGSCARGPVWPNPETCTSTSPVFAAPSVAWSMPQRSSVPGLKFSITTSTCAVRSRTSARPGSVRRSTATDRLLRAIAGHQRLRPSTVTPHPRIGSPVPGGSTLITSAPRSPSSWPANGPAMNEPSSRTRRSASGGRAVGSDTPPSLPSVPDPTPNRAAPNRIGRYDNPYRVATWHREPPAGTVCTPLVLDTQDRALAQGWLYTRGGESTVAVLMHPRADFAHHYVTPGLLDAGIAVLNVNSRWLNNDATLIHEQVLLDVAAALAHARRHFDRVVLVGNSGGASLFTFYLHQALAPEGARLTDTAAGDPFDLNQFELPDADAMVYLAGHPGEGHFLLHAIDPSVTDEDDPRSCNPALDLYDPGNGFVEPPDEPRYAVDFLETYRAAQRARVERIDAEARAAVTRRREARRRWSE